MLCCLWVLFDDALLPMCLNELLLVVAIVRDVTERETVRIKRFLEKRFLPLIVN